MKTAFEFRRPNTRTKGRERATRARRRPLTARMRLGGIVRPPYRRVGLALLAALLLLAGLIAWSGWYLRADQAYNTHNLIRLHVVANSDRPTDQAVKLEVRDAILQASGNLFNGQAPGDAVETVKANLPLFKRVAENVLKAYGYDYPVEAEYGVFTFPERAYGPLVLPAGDYQAVRVVLGDGKGANWWCILFPPLCYLDVVGGSREPRWGLEPGGNLVGQSGRARGGARVVSLDSLTDEQVRDLEKIFERALKRVGDAVASADRPAALTPGTGVGLIISDIPATPDSDLVVLVADTGEDKVEVRFYVFDRLRDLVRSLASAAPWLFAEGPSPGSAESPPPER